MFSSLALMVVAASLAVLFMGLLLCAARLADRCQGRAFQILMILIALSSISTIGFSGRDVSFGFDFNDMSVPALRNGLGSLFAKGLLVCAIGYSVVLCLVWLANRSTYQASRTITGAPDRSFPAVRVMTRAFGTFYLAVSVLPLFFGQSFYFHVSLIYPLFVYLALFLWFDKTHIDPVIVFKQSLGIVVFSSLISILLASQTVLQINYTGLIPGFNIRLWGLAATANGLGAVACCLLLLEVAEPARRWHVRTLILTSSVAALVLAQSKTALLTTIVGITIISGWWICAFLQTAARCSNPAGNRWMSWSILTVAAVTVAATAFGMFNDNHMLVGAVRLLENRLGGDLGTATGRTWIWKAAIQAGFESPSFGQGANFWDVSNRLRLGLSGASNAHNLVLEIFTRAGIVGVAALFILLACLVYYAFLACSASKGASIALLGVFFVRAVTEVPLQPNAILGAEFFSTTTLLFYVLYRSTNAQPFGMSLPVRPASANSGLER